MGSRVGALARRRFVALGTGAVVAALTVGDAGGAGATASRPATSGWWRGAITAAEQWDVTSLNGDGNAGSATLRSPVPRRIKRSTTFSTRPSKPTAAARDGKSRSVGRARALSTLGIPPRTRPVRA